MSRPIRWMPFSRRSVMLGIAVVSGLLLVGWRTASVDVRTPSSVPHAGDRQGGTLDYEVVNRFPHDPRAFTQGLYYEDGFLFEGTGRRGQSSLRKVELETGRVIQQVDLPPALFGEGIAMLGDQIFQLTWLAGTGFVYDKSLTLERRFDYPLEGWGLTTDGQALIASDGSAFLYFLEPTTLDITRRLRVTDASGPRDQLNELEYIDGHVFANVWHRDEILEIDPASGRVVAQYDLSGLLREPPADPEGVLNGIAFDSDGQRLFVTGKLWPAVFEIRLPSRFPRAR